MHSLLVMYYNNFDLALFEITYMIYFDVFIVSYTAPH